MKPTKSPPAVPLKNDARAAPGKVLYYPSRGFPPDGLCMTLGILSFVFQTKKPISQLRKHSTPCVPVQLTKSPNSALRTHRRSRSGGGGGMKIDLDIPQEHVVVTEFANKSPGLDKSPTTDKSRFIYLLFSNHINN